MEVDERPTEQYSDIGGLDKQIQEVYIQLDFHRKRHSMIKMFSLSTVTLALIRSQ